MERNTLCFLDRTLFSCSIQIGSNWGKRVKVIEELSSTKNYPKLIPHYKQTERRLLSVFMSLLDMVPQIRSEFLSKCGYGAGRTCTLQSYMEVGFSSAKYSDVRPDGLLCCKRGSSTWSAFIEAKSEKSPIRPEQIQDYVNLAASLDVDAIITISNEFALSPIELPYHLPVSKRKKRDVYHFAWADIRTFLALQLNSDSMSELEIQLVQACLDFMWNPVSGVATYDAMPPKWPDFVQAASVTLGFGAKTQGITEIIHGWQQERRDLNSKLIQETGLHVGLSHDAGTKATPEDRLSFDRRAMADNYELSAGYGFSTSKARLRVLAELKSCRTSVMLEIPPPPDKKAKATVSWFVASLADLEIGDASVSFDWKGRNQERTMTVAQLLANPEAAYEGQKDAPKAIRVVTSVHDVRRFKSRKKFIEDVEGLTLGTMAIALDAGWV
jgi:hypothetical protein